MKETKNRKRRRGSRVAPGRGNGAAVVAIVSAVLVLALLIGIGEITGKKDETPDTGDGPSQGENSPGTGQAEPGPGTETDPGTEPDIGTEPQPGTEDIPDPPAHRVIAALDDETVAYLMGLDNTTRGWGQGTSYDEKNRPGGAVSAQNTYGVYGSRYIMEDEDKIYLTFDEGYENGYTTNILDALKAKDVQAVFFVTLPYVKSCPDLVQRMIDEGHIVGNHSTAHLSFPSMSLTDAYDDVLELHNYMLENFDYEMEYFRFPMGESSDRMQALLQKMGYTPLFWSFAYMDWDPAAQMSESAALQKVTERAHPGALYLLHAVSSTNAAILADAIDSFRAAGYEICLPGT